MTRQWDGNVADLNEGREYILQADLDALLHKAAVLSSVMHATVTPVLRSTQLYTASERAWFRSPIGSVS